MSGLALTLSYCKQLGLGHDIVVFDYLLETEIGERSEKTRHEEERWACSFPFHSQLNARLRLNFDIRLKMH